MSEQPESLSAAIPPNDSTIIMAAPDPDFWSWVAGGAAAISAGLVAVVWGDAKAKLGRHEDRIVDLYEKLEAHARRDEDHFRELGKMISENHGELLRELNKKADK